MSNIQASGFFVFCKGWDYEHDQEIHGYDGPFATEQDALDYIDWCHSTKHNDESPVSIYKTGQPELLT